jgi:transposase InsO family protein
VTVYRWRKRYDPTDLRSVRSSSRRPRRTLKRQWTAEREQAVRDLRDRFSRFGMAKLVHLLRATGMRLSESMIGRMLASLRRRKMLIEPHTVRERRRRPSRPYATRVPRDKCQPTEPGALIQLDTMHLCPLPNVAGRQFTAIDVVSRCAVLGVRASVTAGTATAFLDDLCARMPVPIQVIQVDGGSEFMAGFEQACQDRGITLYALSPRSPKLNGRVERLNGTARREFWDCYGGDLDLPTLQQALWEWEVLYNTERPHQVLGYLTPFAHLNRLAVSHVSN